jgi:hypothetical protein
MNWNSTAVSWPFCTVKEVGISRTAYIARSKRMLSGRLCLEILSMSLISSSLWALESSLLNISKMLTTRDGIVKMLEVLHSAKRSAVLQ